MPVDPLNTASPTYSTKLKVLVDEIVALKGSITSRLLRKLGTQQDGLEIPATAGKSLQALRVNSAGTGFEYVPIASLAFPTPIPNSLIGWDSTGTILSNISFGAVGSTVAGSFQATGQVVVGGALGTYNSMYLYASPSGIYKGVNMSNASDLAESWNLRYIADNANLFEMFFGKSGKRMLTADLTNGLRLAEYGGMSYMNGLQPALTADRQWQVVDANGNYFSIEYRQAAATSYVQIPYIGKTKSASMTKAAAQALSSGVATTVVFDTATYSEGGTFNAGTGEYQTNSLGYYQINAQVKLQQAAVGAQLYVLVNGVIVAKGIKTTGGASVCYTAQVTSTAPIKIQIITDAAANVDTAADSTRFQVDLLRYA